MKSRAGFSITTANISDDYSIRESSLTVPPPPAYFSFYDKASQKSSAEGGMMEWGWNGVGCGGQFFDVSIVRSTWLYICTRRRLNLRNNDVVSFKRNVVMKVWRFEVLRTPHMHLIPRYEFFALNKPIMLHTQCHGISTGYPLIYGSINPAVFFNIVLPLIFITN